MDAFFASIEQRDHAQWQGKPLVVAHDGPRSVVSAASYEARQYGIRSAMPSVTAKRLCPQLIFAPHRFEVYKEVSHQIMEIFKEHTDLVEPLSLDEAFLDVTVNKQNIVTATEVARRIKDSIHRSTQLTASAGVSYNKFLAKIASDYQKPNGLFVIKPSQGEKFVESLPIERFFGVGKVTLEQMHRLHIYTGKDLKTFSPEALTAQFGRRGLEFYRNARGIDLRPVESQYERLSLGAEVTLDADTCNLDELRLVINELAIEVMQRMRRKQFQGRTVTLKVKYADFSIRSRSHTLPLPIASETELKRTAHALMQDIEFLLPVRLLGLSIKHSKGKETDNRQLLLPFDDSWG